MSSANPINQGIEDDPVLRSFLREQWMLKLLEVENTRGFEENHEELEDVPKGRQVCRFSAALEQIIHLSLRYDF